MDKLEVAYEADKAEIPQPEGIDLKSYFPAGLMPPRPGDLPLLVLTSTKVLEFPPTTTPAMREVVETARGS
jgi:hypothetical protein